MKSKILIIVVAVVILFTANHCASRKMIGVGRFTGFTELPFPSNNYSSGQIVEIYSLPRKVDITYKPNINWDQANTSEGWNISSNETKEIRDNLSAEIANLLKGHYNNVSKQNIKVDFTNTKTVQIDKNIIFNSIRKAFNDDSQLRDQINIYIKNGTHFDVITQTLSANVSFTVVDTLNREIKIDTEAIKDINSKFNVDFKTNTGSNTVITGTNLVVGIHTDPKLIDNVLALLKKS